MDHVGSHMRAVLCFHTGAGRVLNKLLAASQTADVCSDMHNRAGECATHNLLTLHHLR